MSIFNIKIVNQLMIGGILLVTAGAAVLFPDMVSGILGTSLGDFEVPLIGALTVGKLVGVASAVVGTDMLTK